MCGIIGVIDKRRQCMDGSKIRESLALMNERGNGEGAGYAAYGIYPEYKDAYALHVFFDNVRENKPDLVKELEEWGRIIHEEPIPIYEAGIKKVINRGVFFSSPISAVPRNPTPPRTISSCGWSCGSIPHTMAA